jgi:hypothetical protein
MSRSVSIKLTHNSQKPNKKGLLPIKIRITINRKHDLRKTGVEVKPEDWNEKEGIIRTKAVTNYSQANELLSSINRRSSDVTTKLLEGKISKETAFSELMGLNIKEGNILEFVESYQPDGRTKIQTISKHRANIRAIESRLKLDGNKNLVPISFDHLSDLSVIEKINTSITTADLKQNTMASYQKSLNWVATKAKLLNPKPFTTEGYLVSEKPSGKNQPIESNELMLGFNHIKTLHQFEALCFWLYSFCLLGLDGIDICRIDESKIASNAFSGDLSDFIPEAEVLGRKDLAKPLHVHLNRSKTRRQGTDSGVDAIFLINLFPTLHVHRLLKNAMSGKPYAYKGKDTLKLFNFDIENQDGYSKWVNVRKSYYQAIEEKLGTSNQRTRHTISHQGGKIGLSNAKIDELLNHKIKGVLAHYLSPNQLESDIAHTHILQNYSVLEVFKTMLKAFKNKTEVVNGKLVRWIPEDLTSTNYGRKYKGQKYIQDTLKLGYLTSFSREEEIRYQTLMKQASQGKIEVDENGNVYTKPADESTYPKELKDLIAKRTAKYFEPEAKYHDGVWVKKSGIIIPTSVEWTDPQAETKKGSKVIRLKKSS